MICGFSVLELCDTVKVVQLFWFRDTVSPSRSANEEKSLICCNCNLFSPAASIALPIDYDADDVAGNMINDKDVFAYLQSNDINDFHNAANDADKRDPEMYVGSQKRNIISALRAKMRRSKVEEEQDKTRFSPVLSVGRNFVANVDIKRHFRPPQ